MHRILLIDDDEQLGPPLATYFQRFELELTHALKPSEGLARLRSGVFDAAILDVMLPEMDGFELCRTIRKESDIPIVMLTARGDVMDRVVGLELGADAYLPKPFEPRELVAHIQTLLRRLLDLPDDQAAPVRRMRLLLSSGAPLHPWERKAIRDRLCAGFHEYYASTEGGGISLLRPEDIDSHVLPRVVDQDHHPLR